MSADSVSNNAAGGVAPDMTVRVMMDVVLRDARKTKLKNFCGSPKVLTLSVFVSINHVIYAGVS